MTAYPPRTAPARFQPALLGGIVMGVLVIVRHRSNIARMIAGTENRFAKKKPQAK